MEVSLCFEFGHFQILPTLAWCKSTPYMASFLAFSRNNRSAWAGLMDLKKHTLTEIIICNDIVYYLNYLRRSYVCRNSQKLW